MKNRHRDLPLFANLNLLGKCNLDCVFCLGKDLGEKANVDVHKTPADELPNLQEFFYACRWAQIDRIYVTGQNTDPLIYPDLPRLVELCREAGFGTVGLRTNGRLAGGRHSWLRLFDSVGFTALTRDPDVQKRLTGSRIIPDIWSYVRELPHCRVSTVVTTENKHEIVELMRMAYCAGAAYGQIRRVSTDTRCAAMKPHQEAFEEVSQDILSKYPVVGSFGGALIVNIDGLPVTLWKTVETNVNSFNWFANGTWAREYFVVESFLGERYE